MVSRLHSLFSTVQDVAGQGVRLAKYTDEDSRHSFFTCCWGVANRLKEIQDRAEVHITELPEVARLWVDLLLTHSGRTDEPARRYFEDCTFAHLTSLVCGMRGILLVTSATKEIKDICEGLIVLNAAGIACSKALGVRELPKSVALAPPDPKHQVVLHPSLETLPHGAAERGTPGWKPTLVSTK